jgi:hypothetical protein
LLVFKGKNMNNRFAFAFGAMLVVLLIIPNTRCMADDMDALVGQLEVAFQELTPLPNSSVNDDYKTSQIALGSLYATKALGMIYRQNDKMLAKQDAQMQKYDTIIEQNTAIIALLKRMVRQEEKKQADTD